MIRATLNDRAMFILILCHGTENNVLPVDIRPDMLLQVQSPNIWKCKFWTSFWTRFETCKLNIKGMNYTPWLSCQESAISIGCNGFGSCKTLFCISNFATTQPAKFFFKWIAIQKFVHVEWLLYMSKLVDSDDDDNLTWQWALYIKKRTRLNWTLDCKPRATEAAYF